MERLAIFILLVMPMAVLSQDEEGSVVDTTSTSTEASTTTTTVAPCETCTKENPSITVQDHCKTIVLPRYKSKQECEWTINSEGPAIMLDFASFDVEQPDKTGACKYDNVTITDLEGGQQQKLCGNKDPFVMVFETKSLSVKFLSDDTVIADGFNVTWSSVPSCKRDDKGSSGHILSNNYPKKYGLKDDCQWTITAYPGYVIQLVFHHFHLEPRSNKKTCFDNLTITDGDKTNGPYCGTLPVGHIITSTTSKVVLTFTSDESESRTGFNITWSNVLDPNHEVVTTDPNGKIILPSDYKENLSFKWNITAQEKQFVALTFAQGVGNLTCGGDKVEVFDVLGNGSNKSRGSWCVNELPERMKSFGSQIIVVFTSDNNATNNGPAPNGTWHSESECNQTLESPHGYVMTYDYPQNTTTEIPKCEWTIQVNEDYFISMEFEPPLTGCQINDGIFDTGCNVRSPRSSYNSSSSTVNITSSGSPFLATWHSHCGGRQKGEEGTIKSPNHPKQYRNNLDCIWKIEGEENNLVNITFDSTFGIEGNQAGCDYDYIEVFDSNEGNLTSKGKFCGSEAPEHLISYFSNVVVIFHSDQDKGGYGFSLSWKSVKDCGRYFNGRNGSFSFPDRDLVLHSPMTCEWNIVIDSWFSGINYTIKSNGINETVLKVQGDKLVQPGKPTTINETSLIIQFDNTNQVDSSKPHPKFDVTWNAECRHDFNGTNGTISSPNYLESYPNNLDCEWVIRGQENRQVHLDFESDFEIENAKNNSCVYDYVEVLDLYPNKTRRSLGKWCGSKKPDRLTSNTQAMVIRFHSDKDKSYIGFKVNWTTECGDLYSGKNGSLMSPGYSSWYPDNMDCIWTIEVEQGYLVHLKFQTFEMNNQDSCKDYVELKYVEDDNKKLCTDSKETEYTSTSNHLQVTFHSDGEKSAKGFWADWKAVCREMQSGDNGTIKSHGYDMKEYSSNMDCEWHIKGPDGRVVHLTFEESFEIESDDEECTRDYLEVFEVNGDVEKSLGKFCGKTRPGPLSASTNKMIIRFRTDGQVTGKGFALDWNTDCGGKYEGHNGTIQTPSSLPPGVDCNWEIGVPPGYHIHLYPSCNGAPNVTALVGNDNVTIICNEPKPLISTTNTTTVELRSNGAKFEMRWKAVCGEKIQFNETDNEKSLDYPQGLKEYENGMECRWDVEMNNTDRVKITFDKFDLEMSDDCQYDYVQIEETDIPKIPAKKYCGWNLPRDFTSASSKVSVIFHSDEDKNGLGFHLNITRESGCNVISNSNKGHVVSPGYPNKYPDNMVCKTTIVPTGGASINLTFNSFHLENVGADGCVYDYVQVTVGHEEQGKWCGTKLPRDITSTNGDIISIIFQSDAENTYKGFFASWFET